MAKKTVRHADSFQNQIPRRTMLSLPLVAGGMLLVNDSIVMADAQLITVEQVKANTSTGDSLALYTNLLPEVRRSVLALALQGLDKEKAVVSGALRELVQLGKSLDSKYRGSSVPTNADVLADLRQVTGRMYEIEGLADILDATREKLPFIREFDLKVDSIHTLLLNASTNFAKAKLATTTTERTNLRSSGTAMLDDAIRTLKELFGRDVNEAALETPLERLIVLLLGVKVAVEKETPIRTVSTHHASFAGIMDVLRANVKPGSWLQLGIGYAVAFPVLIRNTDRGIREKLLMDGLRLVPGLVPSPLVDTAKQLSVLTL